MPSAIGRALPVLAGFVLAAAAVAAFMLPRTPYTADDPRPEPAAERFLAAWERSLVETYVVDWDFTRVTANGRRLSYPTSLAQRPPEDRLLTGFGTVEGRVDGRVVRCGTDPDGATSCFTGPPAPDYADEVDAEMARLRTYVAGDRPLYDVDGAGAGCFVLRLALALPSPPYGDRATFCFDAETGAHARTVIERPEATDTTELVSVETTVTDADFVLPEAQAG